MGKCCFCGKEINFISENDIRPIKTSGEKGFVCCNDCNSNIVIPTRVALARETGLNDQLILKMNDMLFKNMQKVSRLNGEKKQLKDQLALTEKALELACERISCKNCPHSDGESYCYLAEDCGYYPAPSDCIDEKINYFKTEAKEKESE